jgi:hypothetical protein
MLLLLATTVVADDSSPPATESIGDQLLEDIAPGMFDPPAAPQHDTEDESEPTPRGPELNLQMPGPLDHWREEGEDIGRASPAAPLPLVRAHGGMQRAQSLLAERDTVDRAGDIQQDVVAQLDELIAELSKQCHGGNCQPGDQPPKPSQRSQAKAGSKSGSKSGQGAAAARDSTDRLNSASAQPVEKASVDELVKDLWGHLPERSREQMLQSFSAEFLPEYELEIEKYYARLAEEEAENSPQ